MIKWICRLQFILMIAFMTGCWDSVEIEQRGFVLGIAVDVPKEGTGNENAATMTNQLVVPSALGGPTQSSGDQKAFANLSATGNSMFAVLRELSTQTSRSPYLPHLQAMVVSSELAEKPHMFASIMDLFLRDHEMRRSVSIIISEGEAKEMLEVTTENEKIPVMHIQSTLENSYKNAGVIKPVRIGEVHSYLLKQDSYVLPRMVKRGDKLDHEGAAVFQGYSNRMIGTLGSQETKGYNLITGRTAGGSLKAEVEDQPVTVEMMSLNSSIRITNIAAERVDVSVNAQVEGQISETFGTQNVTSEENVKELEKSMESKMKKLMNQTIEKVQKELQADVLGIEEELRRHHYNHWEKIKNDWDHGQNIFAESTINVTAQVNIDAPGAADKTQKQRSR
ncbi:Ger(x)C family spore germination protein [Lentibacillus jeotgali]|uniref:Ger(x)C family spore germination protein n=1 Tax=Lentibacillus jeotgali TaxID=558169 RepID=UPI0002628F7F|nr:Ger(x)C family spore germination protein [Lentibacillus jeotgali]